MRGKINRAITAAIITGIIIMLREITPVHATEYPKLDLSDKDSVVDTLIMALIRKDIPKIKAVYEEDPLHFAYDKLELYLDAFAFVKEEDLIVIKEERSFNYGADYASYSVHAVNTKPRDIAGYYKVGTIGVGGDGNCLKILLFNRHGRIKLMPLRPDDQPIGKILEVRGVNGRKPPKGQRIFSRERGYRPYLYRKL